MGARILTVDRLKELLAYNEGSGEFRWKSSQRVAGFIDSRGYRRISIDASQYLAHRLAWLYANGKWPNGMLDHINGDKLDNMIGNLRVVTNTINQQNQRAARADNKIGLLGVNFEKWSGKYKAQIRANGKKILIGRFDSPHVAHAAYLSAKRRLHEGCTI